MTLYYLGHRAATRMAKPGETLTPCADFREVFRKTAADPDAAAVVPFENTTQGNVTEVMDLLAATPTLRAVACRAVPVHQHLLSKDLTTPIARILSKAEALAQCRATLARIYPGVPLVPVSSTAEAARLAACDPASAAVAGETTAKRYGLVLRRPDVQDATGNTTRFFRLETHRPEDAHGGPADLPPTHALLYATIDDRPGSLLELLTPLRDIDLTLIQSRPIPGEKWKYAFFLELLIGASSQPLAAVLGALKAVAREVRLLGSYSITTQSTVPDDAGTTALSSLRAMIADIDSSLLTAFAARSRFRLNPARPPRRRPRASRGPPRRLRRHRRPRAPFPFRRPRHRPQTRRAGPLPSRRRRNRRPRQGRGRPPQRSRRATRPRARPDLRSPRRPHRAARQATLLALPRLSPPRLPPHPGPPRPRPVGAPEERPAD